MRQHPIAIGISFGLIVIGVVGGILWYLNARHYESTDDAFIDARPVFISPQVTGNITEVAVTDNQIVHRGDLLARIDPRDYQAAVDQAAAQIKQAEASSANLDAQIVAQQAQIEQAQKQETEAQAALKFSQDENKRYQDLLRTGSGTVQRAQQASSDLQGKQAAFDAVHREVEEKLPPKDRVPVNRYFAGSPVHPGRFAQDWNHSYVLEPEGTPAGAVVLLHGLTECCDVACLEDEGDQGERGALEVEQGGCVPG